MKNNNVARINSRVRHNAFGVGTVVQSDERTTIVLFDDGETKRFVNDAFSSMGYFEILEESLEQIKIERIVVENLFERLNYNIEINTINNVAIFSAPNGCGKTTIFKFLDFIFNPSIKTFFEIKALPFDRFMCELSNGYKVALTRSLLMAPQRGEKRGEKGLKYNIAVSSLDSEYDLCFEICDRENKTETVTFTQTVLDDQKSGASHMYYEDDDDDRYPTGMGMGKYRRFCTRIDALVRKNKCKIGLDFIVANRLQKTYNSQLTRDMIAHGDMEYPRGRGRESEKIDFLQRASDEMTRNIKEWLEEYNRMLEEAKNKLPSMYLMATDHSSDGYEEFENRWNDYHQELEKFYELGILKRTEAVIGSGELQGAYSKKASFLITYLDAFEGTLEPLQKNYLKLKLFSDIFHKRNEITHKTLKFTPNGIEIYSDGKKIDIDCLSSGEKNDFVMFYRLIFNTSINGIVLIDEPEISLHIEWQEDYLDRLIDICQMNGLQAIVATHSPNIVNGHFDLFVDKG